MIETKTFIGKSREAGSAGKLGRERAETLSRDPGAATSSLPLAEREAVRPLAATAQPTIP
jgi:hypothetical protein